MKVITSDIIRTLITDFSQGVMVDFNPETEIGCQRESYSDLGYGWIYFALARALDVKSALVIGSGRGFSVACIGLALDGKAGSEIILVDPGYTEWAVDEEATDRACGLWQDDNDPLSRFREKLGFNNIKLLQLRSDDAFKEFIDSWTFFDLIIIDGDHSRDQSLTDLKNALKVLAPAGILITHDSYCSDWPGVSAAIETIILENPELDRITIPNHPGITMIQRRQSVLSFRIATVEENNIINTWREKEGVAVRPLLLTGVYPDEKDPQPGIHYEDPNVGLFSVFENGELIGGFGIRYKTFTKEGPDDFFPDNGVPVTGYLSYGVVLRSDKRGRGRLITLRCMKLRRLIPEGLYGITRYTQHSPFSPCSVRRVGENYPYFAFHYQLKTIDHAKENEQRFREQKPAGSELIQLEPGNVVNKLFIHRDEESSVTVDEYNELVMRLTELEGQLSSFSTRQASISAEKKFMESTIAGLNASLAQIQNSRTIRMKNFIMKIPGLRHFLNLLR